MRSLSRVVWSEGMYLGTHHFQAQNRYFEESIHFATSALSAHGYGLLGFEMDGEALQNGTVALIHARGVFRDGLIFQMPELDPLPAPRVIGDAFGPTTDSLLIYLTVASRRADGQNTTLMEESARPVTRYIAESEIVFDETDGRDQKPVSIGRKNIALSFERDLPADSVNLAIARIVRSRSGEFVYDLDFVPACLQVGASPRLMSLLQKLIELMEEKSASLIDASQTRTSAQSGYSAREIANYWFRHALNNSLAPLRHSFFTKRGHPEDLYTDLARLAGSLCTFALDASPRDIPLYDHDQPDQVFELLDRRIRGHLEIVLPTNCIRIRLQPTGDFYWAGEISDQRVLGRSNWIFAIHSSLPEMELITRTPQLVKICSRQFVPELVLRALPGLPMTHVVTPPAAINPRIETQYFSLNKSGPCWAHLSETRKVGVYVPGEFSNPEIEILVVIDN